MYPHLGSKATTSHPYVFDMPSSNDQSWLMLKINVCSIQIYCKRWLLHMLRCMALCISIMPPPPPPLYIPIYNIDDRVSIALCVDLYLYTIYYWSQSTHLKDRPDVTRQRPLEITNKWANVYEAISICYPYINLRLLIVNVGVNCKTIKLTRRNILNRS